MENVSIIKVLDQSTQPGIIKKLVGNTTPKGFINIASTADLEANPREAKKSSVTDSIEESLENEPEIFSLKTKGVLMAARSVKFLDRGRVQLEFADPQLEGILDGGHNTFAIMRYILRKTIPNAETVLKPVRRWEDLRRVWDENRAAILQNKDNLPDDIRIPIEILYPGEQEGADDQFSEAILSINAARNNNAQLNQETKANKLGHYEEIKRNVDEDIANETEWKANEGGRIKSRELVALALIPLSQLPDDLPTRSVAANPTMIFSSKGQCVALYSKLMDLETVTAPVNGSIVEIHHEGVKSALSLMINLPDLYDVIYELMPKAYSSGFGKMSCVRLLDPEKAKSNSKKYISRPAKTKFYQRDSAYAYPEGFVYPILWGLTALMEFKDGKMSWKVDPYEFVKAHLPKIMQSYSSLISGNNYDPAKLGKSNGAYQLSAQLFQAAFDADLIERWKKERQN